MTPMPRTATNWISGGKPVRKLQKPAARPSSAIANRSRMRSMNTVPRVRDPDTLALILSRNARYRSPSLAGTRQLTVHDRNRISVASLTPTLIPAPLSRIAQRRPRIGKPA